MVDWEDRKTIIQQGMLISGVAIPRHLTGDDRDVARRAERRAAAREITIPPIRNPERRESCRHALKLFAETYFPDLFYLPWSPDHLIMFADLQRTIIEGGRSVQVADRGKGKSTITVVATLFALLYAWCRFLTIICDTHGNTKDRVDSIRTLIETNDLLLEDFPGPCTCARALEGKYQRAKGQMVAGQRTHMSWGGYERLVFPSLSDCASSGVVIAARSMTSSLRGLQHTTASGEMIRPDIVLLDDPIEDEDAHNDATVEKRRQKILQVAMNLCGPGETLSAIYLGTIIREDDLTSRFLKMPEWCGRKFQLMNSMPENMELWQRYNDAREKSYEDHGDLRLATQFYRDHRAELDKGAEASWPARFRKDEGEISATQFAMNILFEEGEEIFMAEFQNSPLSRAEDARLVLGSHRVETKNTGLERGEVPNDALALVIGGDVGKFGVHWVCLAIAAGRRVSIIDYGVEDVDAPSGAIDPEDTVRRTAAELALIGALRRLRDKFAEEPYRTTAGDPMHPAIVMIDARYEQAVIRQFCGESEGYAPIIGRGTAPKQRSWRVPQGKQIRFTRDRNLYRTVEKDAITYSAHTDAYKATVHGGFLLEIGEAGSIALFKGEHRKSHHTFARHITAEMQQEVAPGIYTWKPARGRAANHWLDGTCYGMAAVSLLEHRTPAVGLSGAQLPPVEDIPPEDGQTQAADPPAVEDGSLAPGPSAKKSTVLTTVLTVEW